jgi:hypothetical protein
MYKFDPKSDGYRFLGEGVTSIGIFDPNKTFTQNHMSNFVLSDLKNMRRICVDGDDRSNRRAHGQLPPPQRRERR